MAREIKVMVVVSGDYEPEEVLASLPQGWTIHDWSNGVKLGAKRWAYPLSVENPAAAFGRLGGQVGGKSTSEAKAEAARANGAKGGRPRKKRRGSE
jgi:hypothetical protein